MTKHHQSHVHAVAAATPRLLLCGRALRRRVTFGLLVPALLFLPALPALPGLTAAEQDAVRGYAMRGLVLSVDAVHKSFVVSHDAVPNVMAAMTMTFDVRDARELEGLGPGVLVEFTLVADQNTAHAERVRIRRYESAEQDPATARRLKLLKEMISRPTKALAVGDAIPDFTLIDQTRTPVALAALRGKV